MSLQLTGLEGKVAVVTGAGRRRGIGRSIALELARAAGVPARTVHYAGFTSLQVALAEQAQRLTAVAN